MRHTEWSCHPALSLAGVRPFELSMSQCTFSLGLPVKPANSLNMTQDRRINKRLPNNLASGGCQPTGSSVFCQLLSAVARPSQVVARLEVMIKTQTVLDSQIQALFDFAFSGDVPHLLPGAPGIKQWHDSSSKSGTHNVQSR
jgi:hypothetical protein